MKAALIVMLFAGQLPIVSAARVEVDPRNPQAYHRLSEAAATLKPGDTLWLTPGSGPYREELFIRASGTKDSPITVEGNGNEITGFDPLVFREGTAEPSVAYPFVLRHQGRRLPEVAVGNFGPSVTYDMSANRLSLAPGTSPEGWEISTRKFAVRIQDASHQIYRDLVASGSLNDGYNLHGVGDSLLFEKITGCENLDEGFSAHDSIHSDIRGGRFFANDNGMLSGQKTVTRMNAVDLWDNLGIGLGFNGEAVIEAQNTRVWGNGMTQLLLRAGVTAAFADVRIYSTPYTTRPWITYKESARASKPITSDVQPGIIWQGPPPEMDNQTAPPQNEFPAIPSTSIP